MFACGFIPWLLMLYALISLTPLPIFALPAPDSQAQCLSYDSALQWALDNSLLLKVSELEVEANEAEWHQACLWPNPIFSIEYESWGTEDSPQGWKGSEMTYGITQVFELGGKCSASRQVLQAHTIGSMWDLESSKLDLALDLTLAFIDAYSWQEKWKLAQQDLHLAEQSRECVHEKINHGKASPLEKYKSDISCLQKQMAVIKAQNQYETAKKKIALLCGCHDLAFECVSYPLFEVSPPPSLPEIQGQLQDSPEWAKSELVCVAAVSETILEKKRRYPDLEVSAGVSSGDGFRNNSFFVEFSIPLPTFDRNQGNIARAYLKESQAYYIKESMQQDLESRFLSSYSAWKSAYETAKGLQTLASVASLASVQGYEEGYGQGKFEKTDFLEAQQASLELHDQCIEALADYHHKKTETLRLIGQLYRCENESEK
jgi:cobalt-zinc-cadmium efflux system outer membrane protein